VLAVAKVEVRSLQTVVLVRNDPVRLAVGVLQVTQALTGRPGKNMGAASLRLQPSQRQSESERTPKKGLLN